MTTHTETNHMKLTRPIAFFDLETTGPIVALDRIVQIAIVKLRPDGSIGSQWATYVKPLIPVSEGAMKVHGISSVTLNEAPEWRAVAGEVVERLRGCDLGGFNNARFDIPMLVAELAREGMTLPDPDARVVDAFRVFTTQHGRTLGDAVRMYCGRDTREHAHDAMADVLDTIEVFRGQFRDVGGDVDAADWAQGLVERERDSSWVDAEGKFVKRGAHTFMTFGKESGKRLEDVDPGYLSWMLRQDFDASVKAVVDSELSRRNDTRLEARRARSES